MERLRRWWPFVAVIAVGVLAQVSYWLALLLPFLVPASFVLGAASVVVLAVRYVRAPKPLKWASIVPRTLLKGFLVTLAMVPLILLGRYCLYAGVRSTYAPFIATVKAEHARTGMYPTNLAPPPSWRCSSRYGETSYSGDGTRFLLTCPIYFWERYSYDSERGWYTWD